MNIKSFVKICKRDQKKLKSYLYRKLYEYGYMNLVSGDGYLLGMGSDIMVTAHMDTVHKENVKDVVIETASEFNIRNKSVVKQFDPKKGWIEKDLSIVAEGDENNIVISSPQGIGGDDRCGIFMILELLERGYRPTVLFCEDEEIGGVGSNKFVRSKNSSILSDMKYLIELDRAGNNDAVFYDCGNKEFQKYILDTTGYVEEIGSFSDIEHLSPEGDVASVNLSCGYYKAHTTSEFVIFEEMMNTIDVTAKLLDDEKNVDKYDYQEVVYTYKKGWYNNWGSYDDDYYSSYYDRGYSGYSDDEYVVYTEVDGVSYMDVIIAYTESSAVWTFMEDHPDLPVTYNGIEVLSYDDYLDYYNEDPYDRMDIIKKENGEDDLEGDDFEDVNGYILDELDDKEIKFVDEWDTYEKYGEVV